MSEERTVGGTPWKVRLAVAGAFAVFLLSMAIIYWSFITTPETNCGIYVYGARELDGGSVAVETISTAGGPAHNYEVKLEEANGHSARFFLTSGTYRVRILPPRGEMLVNDTVFIPPGIRRQYDLTRPLPGGAKPVGVNLD